MWTCILDRFLVKYNPSRKAGKARKLTLKLNMFPKTVTELQTHDSLTQVASSYDQHYLCS